MPDRIRRSWRHDDYLVSTDPALLQPDAINAAFASDMMWWARALPEDTLRVMLDNSLCLGLYKESDDPAEKNSVSNSQRDAASSAREMVGFARIITDYVTLAYMTDVYVLKEHQNKGLGRWMMRCLNEILDDWPELRRLMLITHSPAAGRMYEETLGTIEWSKSPSSRLSLLEKLGGGVQSVPE